MVAMTLAFGCAPKASDEQVNEMCHYYLKITGMSRMTDEAVEIAEVEKKYEEEGKKLQAEVTRDLKGQDDVYAQRLADLEQTDPEITEEEAKEGITKEMKIEELKKKYTEEYEKNKKNLNEEFDKFFNKLPPRKAREIEKIKEFVKERKTKANKAFEECVTGAKKAGTTEEIFNCRMQAKTEGQYKTCK